MADTDAVHIIMSHADVSQDVAEEVLRCLRAAGYAPLESLAALPVEEAAAAIGMTRWHVPDAFYEDLWSGQQDDIQDTWPALYTSGQPRA